MTGVRKVGATVPSDERGAAVSGAFATGKDVTGAMDDGGRVEPELGVFEIVMLGGGV